MPYFLCLTTLFTKFLHVAFRKKAGFLAFPSRVKEADGCSGWQCWSHSVKTFLSFFPLARLLVNGCFILFYLVSLFYVMFQCGVLEQTDSNAPYLYETTCLKQCQRWCWMYLLLSYWSFSTTTNYFIFWLWPIYLGCYPIFSSPNRYAMINPVSEDTFIIKVLYVRILVLFYLHIT